MSTTYPSMLPRPMLSGYGLKVTSGITSTDLERGSPRRRRSATKSKTVLDFSVALTDSQYAIFAAWWRYDLNDGTLPATMQILNGYADHPTTVQFLKPYSATDQLGKWYISCQVEVEPFRLSEAELDAMISGGTIYTLPPEVPGGPGIFPFYGYLRITQQPVSQSVLQPDSATFTIAAVGTGTLSYQWKKNGVNVGTNSTTYNTGATTWTGVDDVITCVVSNGIQSVTSDAATLNVRKVGSSKQQLPDFPVVTLSSSIKGFVTNDTFHVLIMTPLAQPYQFYSGDPNTGAWNKITGPLDTFSGGGNLIGSAETDSTFYCTILKSNIMELYAVNKTSLVWTQLSSFSFSGFQATGLAYDSTNNTLTMFISLGSNSLTPKIYNISNNSWSNGSTINNASVNLDNYAFSPCYLINNEYIFIGLSGIIKINKITSQVNVVSYQGPKTAREPFVIIGSNILHAYNNVVLITDYTTGTYSSVTKQLEASYQTMILHNNYMYLIGGVSGSYLKRVEKISI